MNKHNAPAIAADPIERRRHKACASPKHVSALRQAARSREESVKAFRRMFAEKTRIPPPGAQ